MCDFKLIAEACTAGAPVQSTVFLNIQFIFTFLVRPAPSPLGLDTGFTGWQGGIMKTPNWFENTILHESGLKPNVDQCGKDLVRKNTIPPFHGKWVVWAIFDRAFIQLSLTSLLQLALWTAPGFLR